MSGRLPRVAIVYDVLYPWVRGGAEKRYWEIARRLKKHGFEAHLVGPKYWEGPDAVQREGVWLHGICPPRDLYDEGGTRTIGEAIGYARDLLPALLRLNVELIDCCAVPYFPWFSARTVAALRGTPLLTTWLEYWGPYWRGYLGQAKGTVAQGVEWATARLGTRQLCLSPFTERRLRRVTPGAEITTLAAGIEARRLRGYAMPIAQRTGIICVGRLLGHKRVEDLLRALALLQERGCAAALTIVGRGPEEARLRAAIERLALQEQVVIRSDVPDDDLFVLLGRARCLVLASEREGQGIVIAEAQATGTPPIVAEGPETAACDFVTDGKDGLRYPVGDIEALATMLQRLLGDEALQTRLAEGALASAAALDWDEAIVPRVAALYRSMLAGTRGSRVYKGGLRSARAGV